MTTKTIIVDFFTGGFAGLFAKTVAAPLDRVKILLQTQQGKKGEYTGIANCIAKTYKEEGLLSFWRGNMSNVIRYFPTQAINFAVKGQLKKIFCIYDPKKQPIKFFLGNLLNGGCTGAISLLIVYPLDFARTRLGADKGRSKKDRQFTGIVDCLKKVYKKEGIKGIYSGFGISVFGIFVFRALYFGCYDAGKRFLFKNEQSLPLWKRYIFAQIVTTGSESFGYPNDTVRRKMIMQGGKAEKQYKGVIDCFKKTYQESGIKGFYRGCLSNALRSVGSSLVLVFYDEIQKALKNRKNLNI